ncbi:MAG: response regulator transcription factor [Clostridiales bacterium]|nr:response regulator transcription factor [Clostridiales bacterium]
MIKCVVCDDIKTIREHFAEVINSQDDMTVTGMASTGDEAVKITQQTKPDIVIMDIQMDSSTDGIEATEKITDTTNSKVIMLTIHQSDEFMVDAYLAGAVEYLFKEVDNNIICDTIRNVYKNDSFMSPRLVRKIKEQICKSKRKEMSIMFFINNFSKLTEMERVVLKYLYNGKKRGQIAQSEFISQETVKTHVRHILRKLGFTNVNEMVAFLRSIQIFEDYNL